MEHTLQEDLIGKYLSGELSAREEGELMAWVDASSQNREVFEGTVQLWSLTETSPEPEFPVNLPKAWAALDSRIDLGEDTLVAEPVVSTAKPALQVLSQPKVRSLNWAWSAAAAIAVLVLATWWVFRDTTPETLFFSTLDNQSRSINLPDHSKVVLNENSTISFSFDGATRKVILSGEAFFEVEKDPKHPFVIETGEVQTRVVGTSFNIRAYPDEAKVKVSVKTGRVEMRKVEKTLQEVNPALELLPGNTGVYSTENASLKKASDMASEDVNAWQQGMVILPDGTTLIDVIHTVEKLYNINIQVDQDIQNIPINGIRILSDEKIEGVIEKITFLSGSKFTNVGGTFIISSGM